MDIVVAQTLEQMYTYFYYFYQQVIVSLNITTSIPTPDKAASVLGTVVNNLYQRLPENIQAWYDKLMLLEVQSNVLPLLLALVVLYALYSLILVTLRGIVRLIYGFVRFSLIVLMISSFIYVAQKHWYQVTPLLQRLLDALVGESNGQGTVLVYTSPPVVSPI
ncbi:hypothetical protein BC941DRAFT_434608 [Chlamydoabsidia padenii]|nr:hypothetical protein BC941DRAFT_434608 [Chlamydoabsidia padenii]